MKKQLVIFDLDGTLLNTIGDLAAGCDEMLRQRGLKTHSFADYCSFVGNGIMRLVERALPEELRTAEYVAAARRDFVNYYIDHIDLHTHPYEGIVELVEELAAEGCKLAIASNKFQAGTDKLIKKFFPTIDFVMICGNREGVPLKPDTALVDLILDATEVGRERCVMVGDSAVDILTAQRAGIHSVGVSWGFRSRTELQEAGAEYIADSVAELRSILSAI